MGLDRPVPAGKGVRGEHGGLSSRSSHMGQPGEGSMNHLPFCHRSRFLCMALEAEGKEEVE